MATETEQAAERKPTERVVLRQVAVLVIPEGIDPEKVEEAVKLLGLRKGSKARPAVELAWLEVARHESPSKLAAIEAYAGKAGTSDAKAGLYRAPTVTSWKGGVLMEAPPAPLFQRTVIE